MIVLNKEQEEAANRAVYWFHYSSQQYFSIVGYAGTGKSVVISEIIRRLRLKPEEVLPIAYTGQACTIMRTKGFVNACTCHAGLFNPVKVPMKDNLGRVIIDKQFNTPKTTWSYIPKSFSGTKIKLIVLDEAWMAPEFIRKVLDDTGIKVLAAGDPGQLPPIGGKPAFLMDGIICRLTELMRQSENSPIVYLANRARNGEPICPGVYGNSVFVIFDDELNNEILSRSHIVICAKNATRDYLNNRVRHEILHKFSNYPDYGERIICRHNNWDKSVGNIPLVNGLVGTVISPPDVSRIDKDTLKLDFLPDLTNEKFSNLEINIKYLNMAYKDREFYSRNPYFQGEQFEYAYASTVHLAQGSEYLCGTYIEEAMNPQLVKAANYTAITRFKQQMVYVMHKPKFWNI